VEVVLEAARFPHGKPPEAGLGRRVFAEAAVQWAQYGQQAGMIRGMAGQFQAKEARIGQPALLEELVQLPEGVVESPGVHAGFVGSWCRARFYRTDSRIDCRAGCQYRLLDSDG